MEWINCMIIDPDKNSIDHIERLLLKFKKTKILPSTTDFSNIISSVSKYQPHLLFMDVELSEVSGFEIIDRLIAEGISTKVVLLSSFAHYAVKAIKKRAFDYILKPVDIEDVRNCLHLFIEEFQNQDHYRYAHVLNNSLLSQRENEIIQLVFNGYKSLDIAKKLCLSKHTIDFYRKNILQKVGCRNFIELRNYILNN